MPIPTPFHPRTQALCTSLRWKDWAGYHAVCSFDICHEREYFSIRHAAGLIDVTPLFKYEIYGPDAAVFLARMVVKNIHKLKIGQVTYCCWCDEDGKVVDDGTISYLKENHFRLTAAIPTFYWLKEYSRGLNVTIEDSTHKLAILSLQGPTSRDILKQVSDADLNNLKFFRCTPARIDHFDAVISRTGYTGDLGYEIWVENKHALALWDALISHGKPHGIAPCALDAMDVTRIEAGFILCGIDYLSSPTCLIESRKSSPFEIGLGWAVDLDRDYFNGQAALEREKKEGSKWALVGLVQDWQEYEDLFRKKGLPPQVCSSAWRTAVPVYNREGHQIGQATSGAWSPLLKKNLALATVLSEYSKVGTPINMEVTVEYERRTVRATVSKTPFYNPKRKKA